MKKAIAVTLAFCMLFISGFQVIAKSEVYTGELDFAGSFSGDFAIIGKFDGKMKYGYIDKSGKLVIGIQFNTCKDFSENLAVVGIGKDFSVMKFGYIKTDGSYLIKPQFDSAADMHKGYAKVGIKINGEMKFGIVDNKGRTVIEPKYDDVDITDHLLVKGCFITRLNSKFGLVNVKSGIIIEPQYHSLTFMDNYIRISNVNGGKEKYGFLLFNGQSVEPVYDWIHYYGSIAGVIGMVETKGKYGLMGADGKFVLEPKYDEIREFNDGVSHVKLGDKYGYLDSDGSFLTGIEYEEITSFRKGLSLVRKNGKWGILKIDGTYKADPIYDRVSVWDDRIEVILDGEKKLLNSDGSSKFDESYEYMYPFASIAGASKVKKNGKEIIIDSKGKPVFKKDFDTIGEFENGLASITLNGKMGFLTLDDKYLVSPIYDSAYKDLTEDYYQTKDNEMWGLILKDGTVIKPMSEAPITFKGDYGIIRLGQKQTYINKSGKRLTSETFDYCNPISDSMGRVMANSKTSYISTSGKLMNRSFDFGEDFSDGYACVYESGRYRFIDKNGAFVFGDAARYYSAKPFSSGLAAFMSDNGKWGYIDTKGKTVIQPQFEWAFNFGEGLAPVSKGGKFGFIDKSGKFIVQPVYDCVSEFENGMAGMWKSGKFSYITSKGEIKTDINKNTNYHFTDGAVPAKAISAKDGRSYWGYIKKDGSWLVQPTLDFASPLTNGKGYVWKDSKQGDITQDGKIIWK